MDKIESIIEEKVQHELGKFETNRRRTANQIRDLIQEELSKRPKTVPELQNAIDGTKATVENHLEHLERLEIVESFKLEDVNYWRLSK